jgi:hypothetical protein
MAEVLGRGLATVSGILTRFGIGKRAPSGSSLGSATSELVLLT